jgi:hypothetical protein
MMRDAIVVLFVFGLLVSVLAKAAHSEPSTTYRNAQGQITGYGQTRGNTTVFTNEKGQQVGTSVRSRNGTTTFYNANGQQVGTARR